VAGPSWLGGCEEFEESRPACRRSAATSARSDSISSDCSATTASRSAFLAASSSYDGCSGCGIPEPNHDHKPDASTDTPQITRGPDWLQSNDHSKSWSVGWDTAKCWMLPRDEGGRLVYLGVCFIDLLGNLFGRI